MSEPKLHPVRRPNRRERQWLDEQLRLFRGRARFVEISNNPYDSAVFNEALRECRMERIEMDSNTSIVDQFAIGYGHSLLQMSNGTLEWVVVEKPDGQEFALRGPLGGMMIYVQTTVRHQFSTNENNFFDALFQIHLPLAEMSRLMASTQPSRKPWWKFWR